MPKAHAAQNWEILPSTPTIEAEFQTVSVNGISLAYAVIGNGTPLFLLHGGPANSEYLTIQARALSEYYRVILVDSRGHGRSNAHGHRMVTT